MVAVGHDVCFAEDVEPQRGALLEVERDRRRAGLMTVAVELLADRDDPVFDGDRGLLRAAAGPPGPRLQAGVALGEVALDHGDDPPPADLVVPGDSALAALLDQHSRDDQLGHPHRPPLRSGVNDVPRQVCTMC